MASPQSEIENGRKQELPGLSGEVPSTRGMPVSENENEVEDRNAVSLKGRQFPAGISNDTSGVVLDRHAEITSTSISPRHDMIERENDADNGAEEGDLGAAHAADYEAFMTETAEDDIASYRKSVESAKAWQYDKSSDGGGRENSQPMIARITDERASSAPSKDFSLSNWPDSATEDPEHMISVPRNAEADECTSRAEVLNVAKVATEEDNDESLLNKSQFASRYTAFPAEQITWDAPTRSDWSAEEVQASSFVNQAPQEQDGQFEQVSLQDPQEQTTPSRSGSSLLEKIGLGSFGHLDKTPGLTANNYGTPAPVATKFTADISENLTAPSGPGLEESIRSPDSQKSSPKSFSSLNTSSFSLDERSSFSSPVSSPLLKKGKAVLPNASPELMRLIDSAIQQSDPSSLQKLKSVVAEETLNTYEDGVSFSTSNIVVDVLLAKMGVPEARREDKDTTAPRMMLSVGAALVAGELIPWLPSQECSQGDVDPRTRMVKGLATVLKACTRNRAMCSAAGLLKVLLAACRTIVSSSSNPEAGAAGTWNASPLFDILVVLGSHCLTVQNLQDWLHTVTETIPVCRALDVASALERALAGEETKGPSHTFEFDGESSGLLGPGESRWPFVNGYAFATWLYIESFADTVHTAATAAAIAAAAVAKSGKSSAMSAAAAASALAGEGTVHMPRLFSFLSVDNQGVEAYFHGQFLVVEIASSKGKKASLHFTYSFKPRHWYFVGLEHSYRQSLLGKAESEVKLYVDGCLYESRPFEFPRVSKPLAFCCIGTNPPPTMAGLQRRRRQCPLFAEMGPVYIFKEPIGEDKMGRLAARGGDTVPSFGSGAGMPSFSTNELVREAAEEAMALDLDLGPCLHLLYHPKLLVGRTCPDASPAGAAGTHRRPAEVLGHVHIAARVRPVEAIWAMGEGGPLSLLPLAISAADKDSFEPIVDDSITASRVAVLAAPILHMISLSLQHPGNAEELLRGHAPQLLAQLLAPILRAPLQVQEINAIREQERPDARNEEVVAAVVLLAQAPANNENLKVPLFGKLLLDLKLWSCCSYGLQKKLLSSLADMVFTESATMRAANAVQVLLDCCRKCYWVIPEPDSVHMFAGGKLPRPVGELNALIDELLVVIELLLGTSRGAVASTDVQSLVRFLLDCPQPNQVARVLRLLYRLVVQPNASRAAIFAENFLYCGGIEMLLALLQRECEASENPPYMHWLEREEGELELQQKENDKNEAPEVSEIKQDVHVESDEDGISLVKNASPPKTPENITRSESLEPGTRMTGQLTGRNLGGIGLSITADKAKNNFRNIDSADGVMVGIISLLGALVTGGHLKLPSSSLSSSSALNAPSNPISAPIQTSASTPTPSTVISGEQFQASIDSSRWLLYALQKAFQTAPKRLLTDSVYEALLAAVIRSEAASLSSDDRLNLYDSFHSFEHTQLLLVLLRALPYGSKSLQIRALQDVLFLACTRSENRTILTAMPEWPEWLLEIMISNYEAGSLKLQEGAASSSEIEDLVYNFLIIILEHSMRQKDGWKDVESTIHCAEWLAMIGGTTSGEQRQRREESLPVIKRKLLGGLLDFAARELQLQTQVVAAAAAGVAAGGLSPKEAKAEADAAAFLSVSLAENAIVLLMLVEDHLRLQCQIFNPSLSSAPLSSGPASPRSFMPSPSLMGLGRTYSDGGEGLGSRRFSSSQDSGGLSLDVLASMADSNGQISAAAMERLTAAAAAEPYESVRCAFVSYGSCGVDLVDGWKRRSRMWYGVGLPARGIVFGGGGSGWDAWMSVIEKDENGEWIELPLIRKSISMLQALLLDDSGAAAGGSIFGYGGGAGTGAGGMHALQQLLDSDQPFFTMLRMVLVAMREEDKGSDKSSPNLSRTRSTVESFPTKVSRIDSFSSMSGNIALPHNKKTKAALLWCVLAPLLTMPLTESRRQRVLVSACILYSEVWHAVSADKKVLRRHYLEMIIPPFATLLRRWRPLLSGIHELTDADGQSPLAVEDRSLAIDAHPLEAASAMVTPEWAAAFASPPAAMALAMAAAGAGGGEVNSSKGNQPKREFSALEKKTSRLRSFATFQKIPDSPGKVLPPPKDKAAAKAAAMAAARDQERAAKIGSGRGLGAVAMASSAQRRTSSDRGRAKRWGIFESMNSAWLECAASQGTGHDFQEREGNVASLKLFLSLQEMMEIARNLQQTEARRRLLCLAADENDASMGARSWRLLVQHLLEMEALFGSVAHQILKDQRIFWKLDTMENSMRMRKRIKRNYKGTNHYGAAADHVDAQEIGGNGGGALFEKDSEASLRKTPLPPEAANLLPEQQIFDEAGDDETFQNNASELEDRRDDRLSVSSKQSSSEDHTLTGSSMFNTATSVGSPSSLTGNAQIGSTDMNEKVLLDIPTVLVQPLRTSKGTFQVTSRHIIFSPDNSMQLDESGKEDTQGSNLKPAGTARAWSLSTLREVYSRRYLLRKSALELFMVDRSNYFFDFETAEGRRKAYKALVQARPPFMNNIYAGTQRPEQLLKRTQLTERWARWEISNFEYLMQLNTLAGRSYNDITQYPVFPWILADYSSESLDFDNPNIYRDLSKPVGALNSNRLEKYLERYENFDDPLIPRFHYGSHYSSAGTVLYYLVRLEPFTTLSIQLQGGKFDHADRMFGDIGSTWNGVLEDMSDVKELVPELFYLPEILLNVNKIGLGKTQKGENLENVKLPPWAASPVDFVQKHRAALESQHVSANLHNWIDLIFGYKQRGKEAVAANNVFFYMTYEGAVDIDKIDDPVLRKATQDQIAYFGQTPSQLLTSPHIKRMPLEDVIHLQTIFRNPSAAQCYTVPFCERCNVPAGAIATTHESVITVDTNAPACTVAVHRWQPHTPDGHGLPFHFQHGKPAASSGGGALVRMFSRQAGSGATEWRYPRAVALGAPGVQSCHIVAITQDGNLLTGGHADNSLKLVAGDTARVLESAFGHGAPITCLSLSPDGTTCITGSRDCTAMLWRIHSNSSASSSSSSHISDTAMLAAAKSTTDNIDTNIVAGGRKRRIEGPIHVLRGHVDDLMCCCINADLDVAVSCSQLRGVLIHSLVRGRLLHRLHLPRADVVALSSEGILIVWDKHSRCLSTFTINGIQMAAVVLPTCDGDVSCITVATDGHHAVVGTSCTKYQQPDVSWYANNPTASEVWQHHNFQDSQQPGIASRSEQANEHSNEYGKEDGRMLHARSREEIEAAQPCPGVTLFDLYTLQAIHKFKLQQGQDVTALALNRDSTNLVVSTADGQLLVYTDPALSIKVVDQMLRLGWQGAGLAGYIS